MSVSRRQFFALMGATATLLPLPRLAHAESTSDVRIDEKHGRAFRIVEVQYGMFLNGPATMHVKGIEVGGWMQVTFNMYTEKLGELRLNDIVYIDVANMTWPMHIDSDQGKLAGLSELTLTIPSLAERDAMEAWRDEQ